MVAADRLVLGPYRRSFRNRTLSSAFGAEHLRRSSVPPRHGPSVVLGAHPGAVAAYFWQWEGRLAAASLDMLGPRAALAHPGEGGE